MNSYFLAFPAGTVDLEPGEDDGTTSRRIADLLLDEPWVQLHARHVKDQYTQWTVMNRDEHGVPQQITCEQFDGSLSVLNNGE